MALAVNSEMPSNAGFNGAGSPWTYSFNNASGTLLVVGVLATCTSGATVTISGVTYNGVAMTAVPSGTVSWSSGASKITFFYLLNPATGSNTVSITWSATTGAIDSISGAISFTGNDAANPVRSTTFTAVAPNSSDAGPATVGVTGTTTGNIVVDMAGCGASAGFSGRTNTLSWAKNVSGSSSGDNAESTRANGNGGTVTVSHTLSAGDWWGVVAIEVAAAGGAVPTYRRDFGPSSQGPSGPQKFQSEGAYLVPEPPPAAPDYWRSRGPPVGPSSQGPRGNFVRKQPAYFTPVGGTTFFVTLDGTLSMTGSLTLQTQKVLAGTVAPTGALTKLVQVLKAGTLTTAGALLKQTSKSFAGTLTTAGALLKQVQKVLSGTLTSSGTLTTVKVALKSFTGTLTMSGALTKQTQKPLGGTLASSGALTRQVQKVLAGTLTTAGALVRQTQKLFAGTLTSSGALVLAKVALKSLTGTLTSSGTLSRQVQKSLAGTLSTSGALSRLVFRGLAGVLAPVGTLTKKTTRSVTGTLSFVGTLAAQIVGAVTAAIGPLLFGRADAPGLTGRDDRPGVSGRADAPTLTGKDGGDLKGRDDTSPVKGKVD